MSQFGIKFDTTSEERRDRFYAALIANRADEPDLGSRWTRVLEGGSE